MVRTSENEGVGGDGAVKHRNVRVSPGHTTEECDTKISEDSIIAGGRQEDLQRGKEWRLQAWLSGSRMRMIKMPFDH